MQGSRKEYSKPIMKTCKEDVRKEVLPMWTVK